MSDKSRIEWCDATINVVYGCTPQSPGCDNCYAVRLAPRLGALTAGTHQDGAWTGKLNIFPERMLQACRWRKPRRIFVNSMGDLFHKDVPDTALDMVFAAMALCPRHEFILLTKRPERMRAYLTRMSPQHHRQVLERTAYVLAGFSDEAQCLAANALNGVLSHGRNVYWPMQNVILMSTAENQQCFDMRAPEIMALARLGWRTGMSLEPLLGPVDVGPGTIWISRQAKEMARSIDYALAMGGSEPEDYGPTLPPKLDWIICGGETGPGARPMHPDWVRAVREACVDAGVSFFFKSWGEWGPGRYKPGCQSKVMGASSDVAWPDGSIGGGTAEQCGGPGESLYHGGKQGTGRHLDGRTWEQFPEARP